MSTARSASGAAPPNGLRKSSSKVLLGKARSVRNVGKAAAKFRFDLLPETVDRLVGVTDVVLSWERSAKLDLATPAVRVDRTSRTATFNGERLSQDITLFKKGNGYGDKVYKFAVRVAGGSGADAKVVGKIRLNMAEYAGVPSHSRRVAAELSNGSTLIATISSTFLGMGKSKGGGGSVAGSEASGITSFSGGGGSGGGGGSVGGGGAGAGSDQDDLTDLEIDDEGGSFRSLSDVGRTDADVTAPPAPPARPPSGGYTAPTVGGYAGAAAAPSRSSRSASPSGARDYATPSGANPPPPRDEAPDRSGSTRAGLGSLRRRKNAPPPGPAAAPDPDLLAELDRLRRDNVRLARRADDATAQAEAAEEEARRLRSAAGRVAAAEAEAAAIGAEVADLKAVLAREPAYGDVVTQLRDAKLALALLEEDKQSLIGQLRKKSGGSGGGGGAAGGMAALAGVSGKLFGGGAR